MKREEKKGLPFFGIPKLAPYLKPYRMLFFWMVTMGGIGSAMDAVIPLFQQYAIDHFIADGAMNGLGLCDSLTWVFFFWEITTLCSFFLISHDGTREAKRNATRALWMNMVGGIGFLAAMLFMQKAIGTLSIQAMLAQSVVMHSTAAMLPIAFLCFAAFTKSAQLPFQSWLCGAMVAPTPVSALLHSSTMVKAGVYLVLRLSPAFAGTMLAGIVSLTGAFTFVAASALACGQSNGKKILAYSTIANLGLIIACAGMATPAAITASCSSSSTRFPRASSSSAWAPSNSTSARVTSNPCAACTRSCPAWRSSRCSAS